MANQILSMNKLHLILRLLLDGKSRRHISRTSEVSRKAVDKYVHIFNSHSFSLFELQKLGEYDLQQIVKPGFKQKPTLEALYEYFPTVVKELKKVGIVPSLMMVLVIHNFVNTSILTSKAKNSVMFLSTKPQIN
jgi:Ni/Fe-hydrogenase subunit HybB-like protein